MEKKPKQTREAARIASLTKKVEKLKQDIEGYRQIASCMDAVFYEICVKYGERIMVDSDGTPLKTRIRIPVPDVGKLKSIKIDARKDDGSNEYVIIARPYEKEP